jgi:tetratricopeptide (TPR) repeat protein
VKPFLLLLALLLPFTLFAQGDATQLSGLRLQVAQNPADVSLRLELAYRSALAGDMEEALKHYQLVLVQDPQNILAAEGVLWALQSLNRIEESVLQAEALLQIHPKNPNLYSFLGYGYSQQNRHLQARYAYNLAARYATDTQNRDTAQNGLAWEYIFLQNMAAADRALCKVSSAKDEHALQLIHKTRISATASFSTDYRDLQSLGLRAEIKQKSLALALYAEQIVMEGESFSKRWGAGMGWNLANLAIEASLSLLSGDDPRIYPASLGSAGISAKLYWQNLQIDPLLRLGYGHYERLDSQQLDAGLILNTHSWDAGYRFSYVYIDSELPRGDSQKGLHSANLGCRIFPQTHAALYLFLGDQAWWVNQFGVVYDKFDAQSRAYAISITQTLSQRLTGIIYQQIGFEDEAQYSTSLSISLAY